MAKKDAVKEYCERHGLENGVLDNIAVTFETIQYSLEDIIVSAQDNGELMNQLIEKEFIKQPEENESNYEPKENVEKPTIKEHYFSEVFSGADRRENKVINGPWLNNQIKNNDSFKIMVVLFRMCSNADFITELKEINPYLSGYKGVYVDQIDQKFESLIFKINKIEGGEKNKAKVKTENIIEIFEEFGKINEIIQNMSEQLFSVTQYKESLSTLANKYFRTNNIKSYIDNDAKLSTNIIENNVQSMPDGNTGQIDDNATLLMNVIKNNAPSMLKDNVFLKEQISTNQDLKKNLELYKLNQDERKKYTLLNPCLFCCALIFLIQNKFKKLCGMKLK